MNDCVFCKVVSGALPNFTVFEDDEVLVFLDIFPVNPGHALIIPKQHLQYVTEVDDAVLAKMMRLAKRLDARLRSSDIRCEDVFIAFSDGPAAGQEIPHCHLHVIPRFTGDGFGFRHGPENRQKIDASLAETMVSMLTDAFA